MQGKSTIDSSLVITPAFVKKSTTLLCSLLPSLLSLLLLSPAILADTGELAPGFSTNTHIEILHDDNVRRTTDDSEQSDTIFAVNPKLQWLALFGKHQIKLNYKGDFGFYSDEDKLNYDDHNIKARGEFDHSYHVSTQFELGYKEDHDDPGSTNAIAFNTEEFNLFSDKHAKGTFFYGRQESQGQLALRVNHHQLNYNNNQQQYRDHNRDAITATFFYRVAPKTRVLIESAYTEYDYQNRNSFNQGNFDQSNSDIRYLLGVEWQGTAKTTGIFKVGQQNKDYKSTVFNEISGLTLSLDMIWKPNTYTTIKIGASRDTEESAQVFTNGFVSEYLRADLNHLLTPRTTLTARMGYGDEEYAYAIDRNDKRKEVRIGIEHELRRWLTLGSELQHESRNSNNRIYNYTANAMTVYIHASFD
jgi:polysaccharide biosynthesis protein VpsM